MRPLTLRLQAFGPFAGSECIDFAELGSAPLFLINGPTGAGKTTILDAICYALYGSTTGAEREAAEMRCQFSAAALLTEVELRFELAGQRYQITRVPEQPRPKQRGDGVTVQRAKAELYRLGADDSTTAGTLLVEQKVQDANRFIVDITGMNAEQFRQVMVLPQGQFRKLLMADSQEREQIFQSLFQTTVYKQIEERLKQAAGEINRDFKTGRDKLQGILEAGEVADEAALETELARFTELYEQQQSEQREAYGRWQQAGQQLTLARQWQQTRSRLSDARARQASLQAREADMQQLREQLLLAGEAARLEPAREKRRAAEDALAQALEERDRAAEQRSQAVARRETAAAALAREQAGETERTRTRQRIAELEALRPRVGRLAEAAREASQRAAAVQELESEARAARAALVEARGEMQRVAAEIQQLQQRVAAAEGGELALHRAREMQDRVRQLQRLEASLAQVSAQRSESETRRGVLAGALESTRAVYTALRRDWHLGQARLLAAALEPGQPCPVCGSEVHPCPASGEGAAPDESALEAAEARCREAEAALSRCERELASLCSQQSALQQQIEEIPGAREASGLPSPETLAQDVASLEAQLTRRREDQARQQALAQQQGARERRCREAEEAANALLAEEAGAREALASARAQLGALEAELPEGIRELPALEGALQEENARLGALQQALASAQAEDARADRQLGVAEERLSRAARQQVECEQRAREAGLDYREALEASPFAGEEERALAAMPGAEREARQGELEAHERQLREVQVTLRTLEEELADSEAADVSALERDELAAREARDAAQVALDGTRSRLDSLCNTRNKLARQWQANRELEQQYAVVGTLADVACGQTGAKISLQRYVLGVLLDDVLAQASQRLLKMSGGRYQLLRKLDPNKGRRAAGLDLEVHDDFTGVARSVATLSGGESFMAALSLALGLSDVVQSQTGGIALDTLFVDEGFGSLDSEALELAIHTLMDLQRAGRMVGIISHVSELREQMDVRIDLHTSRRGSRLQVVSPFAGTSTRRSA